MKGFMYRPSQQFYKERHATLNGDQYLPKHRALSSVTEPINDKHLPWV